MPAVRSAGANSRLQTYSLVGHDLDHVQKSSVQSADQKMGSEC